MSPELLNLFLLGFFWFVFPLDFHSPDWDWDWEDFVLFSINQFSQPFNSEIYIYIVDLLLSLYYTQERCILFFSCRFLFPPYFLWRFIGLVFWMSERIRTRNLSTTNPVLSLCSISPFFSFSLSWQLFVCVHCFHFSFLVHNV
jgi:hypothetical protein